MRLFCLTLLLAGCASTAPARVVEGNDRSVIVYWGTSIANTSDGALTVADQHCKKFGRSARYNQGAGDFKIAYDCI